MPQWHLTQLVSFQGGERRNRSRPGPGGVASGARARPAGLILPAVFTTAAAVFSSPTLASSSSRLGLAEHEAHDVLEHLGLGVGAEPDLLHQLAGPGDHLVGHPERLSSSTRAAAWAVFWSRRHRRYPGRPSGIRGAGEAKRRT